MIIALLAATVLMAETASALPVQPAAPAASSAPAVQPKKAEVKFACHREAGLGTRLPTRPCRPPAQMAEQQQGEAAKPEPEPSGQK